MNDVPLLHNHEVKRRIAISTSKQGRNTINLIINENPERDVLPLRNANHLKRNKIANISDSITKPIDMRRFNKIIVNGDAVKRAHGGATASKLNHISHDIMIEDKPNIVIICAGTNNFTTKNQSTEETTGEIIGKVPKKFSYQPSHVALNITRMLRK